MKFFFISHREFAKERGRVEKRRKYLRKHRQEIMNHELNNYMSWITNAENALLKDEHVSRELKAHIFQVRTRNQLRMTKKSKGKVKLQNAIELSVTTASAKISFGDNDDVFELPFETVKKNPEPRLSKSELPWPARVRRRVRKFVQSQFFFWFILVLVVLNAISQGVEHYNEPTWLKHTLCMF